MPLPLSKICIDHDARIAVFRAADEMTRTLEERNVAIDPILELEMELYSSTVTAPIKSWVKSPTASPSTTMRPTG